VSLAIAMSAIAAGSLLAVEPTKKRADPIAGGWVTLSPAGVAIPGPGSTTDIRVFDRAVAAGYRWGIGVGLAFEPIPHLLVAASGNVTQSLWMFDNDHAYELCFRGDCYGSTERGLGHLLRFGAELRLGWTSRYVLAWSLFGAHVGLSHIRLDCENSVEAHCDRGELDVGLGLRGGLGFALRASPTFAIGLESSIDHVRADRRDDPFRAVRTGDLGLIAIVRF
jgi:hypothetical protein